jgi:hypothetical protein
LPKKPQAEPAIQVQTAKESSFDLRMIMIKIDSILTYVFALINLRYVKNCQLGFTEFYLSARSDSNPAKLNL